jgi:hypothetical protein
VSFALFDAQNHAVAVNVANLERSHFAGAQAGPVSDRQRNLVFQTPARGNQPLHFFPAQNDRQFLRDPYRLHAGHQFSPVKRDVEEELQSEYRCIDRDRRSARINQM